MNAPAQQMSPDQQNSLMRSRLCATGLWSEKDLGTFSLSMGGTTRIKLQNIGITHRLRLMFTTTMTIATATAALSPFGMYNAIPRIRIDDYDGQPRINASASHILMRNILRERRIDGSTRDSLAAIAGSSFFPSSSVTIPNLGLTVGAQTGIFFLDIPICFDSDMGDLRGAMATQSTVGEINLSIDCVQLASLYGANDDTKVINNAATVTAATFNVQVMQEFILPQPDIMLNNMVPIPSLDIQTVYEIVTQQTSDNLAASQEKLISLPNTRLVNALYYRWFNNSYQGGTGTTNDLTQHRLILNGTTPIKTRNFNYQFMLQRQDIGSDLPKGAYFFDFLGLIGSNKQAIQTSQLGNVQLGLTIPAAGTSGTSYIDYAVESFYMKGVALGSVIPGN